MGRTCCVRCQSAKLVAPLLCAGRICTPQRRPQPQHLLDPKSTHGSRDQVEKKDVLKRKLWAWHLGAGQTPWTLDPGHEPLNPAYLLRRRACSTTSMLRVRGAFATSNSPMKVPADRIVSRARNRSKYLVIVLLNTVKNPWRSPWVLV